MVSYEQPTDQDRYRMIKTYFEMLVEEIAVEERAEAARAEAIIASGQIAREQRHRDCVGKMKQFASWFTHGVPGGGALRKQIFEAKNGGVVLDSVERFFDSARRVRGDHSISTEAGCRQMILLWLLLTAIDF